MNEQLANQAADIRAAFESEGFQVAAKAESPRVVEATIPTDRHRWQAVLTEDAAQERLDLSLWKNGEQIYNVPLNPAAPASAIVAGLQHVFLYAYSFDPDATNDDIDRAVCRIRDTIPINTHGYMGDRSPLAVLANAVLRLSARVNQLDTGGGVTGNG